MFTDQDYQEYFEQIASLERLMVYHVFDLLQEVEDPQILQQLKTIGSDEKKHYALIVRVFNTILFKSDLERRKFIREHVLGWVKVRHVADGSITEGYCVDLSAQGVCIEFEDDKQDLKGDIEVWIETFEDGKLYHHMGRVAWTTRHAANQRIGAIRFKIGVSFAE